MTAVGKIKPKPANKGAILGYSLTSLIFVGIGVLCFILLLRITPQGSTETIGEIISLLLNDLMELIVGTGATIAQYWWIILLIVVGLTAIGFLVGWLLLVLVAKFGHIIVYAGCIFYIIGAIVGALLFGLTNPIGMIGTLLPAVGLIIGMITNFKKFKRAGEFMKFTGRVVLAEKGMIIAPLFVTFVSIINFITMGSIFAFLVFTFQGSVEWLGYVLGSLASLLQLVIYYGMFYVAEAINTTYAYEWYRKRDPDMKFCVRNVAGMFGPILIFGIVTALVTWAQQMLRNSAAKTSKQGNALGIIFAILARIVARIMGIIFKYLTYFTLPAIAIEGRKFKDGVTRSFALLKKYYMDVLIRETGVSTGMSFIQAIAFLIYGIIGAIIGVILKGVLGTGITWTVALLVTIIPMLIFGNIPTFFIFRPMKTAYLTFIFAYAQDEETNHKLPSRMPAELRGDIKEAGRSLDSNKSIAKLVM